MSGYQSLRPLANGDSTTPAYEPSGWYGEQSDPPMLLARVADFTAVPDESCDASCDAGEELHEEPLAGRESGTAQTDLAVRSRLAVGGLVVVAALTGFVLGRATAPERQSDPDLWRPTPSASEAPGWESQSLATSQASDARSTESKQDSSTPWTTPNSGLPGSTNQSPNPTWGPTSPSPPNRPADANRHQAHWTANQGMTLTGTPAQGQPARPPVEDDSTAAAMLARRPMTPVQPYPPSNAQPNSQAGGQPTGFSPVGVPSRYETQNLPPGVYQNGPSVNSPSVSNQYQGYSNSARPATDYRTSYPQYPQTGPVPNRQPNNSVPVNQVWQNENRLYPD